jgi:hypothetical protein
MTIDQLKKVHQAAPFRPFTLDLADGNKVRVRHPEMLAYFPKGRTIAVAIGEDVIKIIDLMLVASIEVGNGKPRATRKRKRG